MNNIEINQTQNENIAQYVCFPHTLLTMHTLLVGLCIISLTVKLVVINVGLDSRSTGIYYSYA